MSTNALYWYNHFIYVDCSIYNDEYIYVKLSIYKKCEVYHTVYIRIYK
ncbi:hypothetical protein VPHD63_0049 [Vibrio phage D63]